MIESRAPTQIFASKGRTVVRFLRDLFVTAAALMVIAVIVLLVTSLLFPASFGRHSYDLDATYERIEKELNREQ